MMRHGSLVLLGAFFFVVLGAVLVFGNPGTNSIFTFGSVGNPTSVGHRVFASTPTAQCPGMLTMTYDVRSGGEGGPSHWMALYYNDGGTQRRIFQTWDGVLLYSDNTLKLPPRGSDTPTVLFDPDPRYLPIFVDPQTFTPQEFPIIAECIRENLSGLEGALATMEAIPVKHISGVVYGDPDRLAQEASRNTSTMASQPTMPTAVLMDSIASPVDQGTGGEASGPIAEASQGAEFSLSTLKVGDHVGGFIVQSIKHLDERMPLDQAVEIDFVGTTTVQGTYFDYSRSDNEWPYGISDLTLESRQRLPHQETDTLTPLVVFPAAPQNAPENGETVEAVLKEYRYLHYPVGGGWNGVAISITKI
jgi:hypothetical protein